MSTGVAALVATIAVIVVVVVAVVVTPTVMTKVITLMVVVVLALGATTVVATVRLVSTIMAIMTMVRLTVTPTPTFVVAADGTRRWWVVRELLKDSRWHLLSINHTQIPFWEATLTKGEFAVAVDGTDGVVVNFFKVDDDAVLAPMLPVLMQRLRHHYGCQNSILCTAGEG